MTCERNFSTALLAVVFLNEAEDRAAKHDGKHNAGIDPFPHDAGDNRSKDEDQDQRAFELTQQQAQGGGLLLRLIVLSPYCFRRLSASAGWRPSLEVCSAERSCSMVRDQ